jgi:hypothetical protein
MVNDYVRQLRAEARRYYALAHSSADVAERVVWLRHAQTMVDLAEAAEETHQSIEKQMAAVDSVESQKQY